MFGGLRVLRSGTTITRFRSQKFGVLLAYLACHLDRTHPRELLITLLWPEAEREHGRNNLRVALSSLRHQLEPPGVPGGTVLQADRFSVRLNPDAVSADVTEFDAAVTGAARPAAAAERVRLLEAAVRLYQGEFLPGYYDDWVLEEQRRLAEAFVGAAHGLVRELEKAGDVAGALEHARHAVQVEPMREEFRRDLMRLLASSGDREGIDAALRQFNDWDRRGAQEGWEPGPALRQYARDLERRAQASPAAPEIPRRVVEGSGGAPAPVVPSRTPEGFPPAEAPHPRAARRAGPCFGSPPAPKVTAAPS